MKNSTILLLTATALVAILFLSVLFDSDKIMTAVNFILWAVFQSAGFVCKTIEEK